VPTVPSDEEFLAYNQVVINEFRANHGVVSQPPFPILLLTTTGARTGRSATVPVGFAVDDSGRVFVVASKAGAPRHPAWFHNLRANPSVTVELGDRSFQARGRRDGGAGTRPALRHGLRSRLRIREEHRPGLPCHRPRRRPCSRLTTSPGRAAIISQARK
jgi:deazaflavin-dependent oxidoreductase (nitroreductase family)